jgi:NAD(P)H dehydrogenase (quinone)
MAIAVTGANGEFGRAVLESLRQRTDEALIGTVREPAKSEPLPGVDYRPGNFDEPDALRASLAGVDSILVNATFFGADPSRRLGRVAAAIRAAASAGVGRIVLTSWSDLERARHPGIQDYRELEALVQAAGPAWTILRLCYGLADAVARDVVWARSAGELVAPASGARVTPAAVDDLAEAAAAVLSQPGNERERYELTGPDAVTWDELAELAGVKFRAVDDDEYRNFVARFNLPAPVIEQLIDLYVDFRSGWSGEPTATVEDLIGRPPVKGIEAVARRVARFPGTLT